MLKTKLKPLFSSMQANELGLLIHHCTVCLINETHHLYLPPFLLAP